MGKVVQIGDVAVPEESMMYPSGSLGDDFNPFSRIVPLLVVESDDEVGWITDANQLYCEEVGWDRGHFGDPRDPDCTTQTLIGKPLDVLVPPRYRRAHRLFRMAFIENPEPRTMGEGRNTPVWVKDRNIKVDGIDSITGREATVIIGLSQLDLHHTLAMMQSMTVSKSFSLPRSREYTEEEKEAALNSFIEDAE